MGTKQTCVDISKVVTEMMGSRNSSLRPEIAWVHADCTDLGVFADASFDLVVDKSTFDALVTHEKQALVTVKFLKEASRICKTNRHFVCISLHSPPSVLPWLRRRCFDWTVRVVP